MNEEIDELDDFTTKFTHIQQLIPDIIGAVSRDMIEELNRHFDAEIEGKDDSIKEMELFSSIGSFLQGKWNIEVIYSLVRLRRSYFTDLKNFIPSIGAKTLTDRLRLFEAEGLVDRIVEDTSPVRVAYTLTNFGRNLVYLLLPAVVYYSAQNRTQTS